MKIKHFLYNSFIIENEKIKIAIDPGLNMWLFKLGSLIPKSEWVSITHISVIIFGNQFISQFPP